METLNTIKEKIKTIITLIETDNWEAIQADVEAINKLNKEELSKDPNFWTINNYTYFYTDKGKPKYLSMLKYIKDREDEAIKLRHLSIYTHMKEQYRFNFKTLLDILNDQKDEKKLKLSLTLEERNERATSKGTENEDT